MVARRGATKLGCLIQLMVLAAIGYFGTPIAEIYLKHAKFKDRVTQEARFMAQKNIPEIRQRIRFIADSMGLPEDAGIAQVRKSGGTTYIESHYEETIVLPGRTREIHFEVKAQGRY